MDAHLCNDLFEAAREGHDTCIEKFIFAGADPNVVNTHGGTPLHYAASRGHDCCVRTLIEAGANPNAVDTSGWTPLHWASMAEREMCTRILIDAGADLAQCISLHQAAHFGHDVRIRTLIAAGADPNVTDNSGMTPLHDAAHFGHTAYVWTALITSGGDPNAADNCGRTPLHIASSKDRASYVRMLIDAGADPNVVDNDEKTPLQLAVEKGHRECANILVVHVIADRALTEDEWDLVPPNSDIGHLLRVVLTRDGLDAAAKLVSRLPEEKRKVLENAMLCLSRFVSRDLVERIVVRCV